MEPTSLRRPSPQMRVRLSRVGPWRQRAGPRGAGAVGLGYPARTANNVTATATVKALTAHIWAMVAKDRIPAFMRLNGKDPQ